MTSSPNVLAALKTVFPWAFIEFNDYKIEANLGDNFWIRVRLITSVSCVKRQFLMRERTPAPEWGDGWHLGDVIAEDLFDPDDRFQQHMAGWLSTARGYYNHKTYRDLPTGSKVTIEDLKLFKRSEEDTFVRLQLARNPSVVLVQVPAPFVEEEEDGHPVRWVWCHNGVEIEGLADLDFSTAPEAVQAFKELKA